MQISHGHENGKSIETESKEKYIHYTGDRFYFTARNMMQMMHHATGFLIWGFVRIKYSN